MLWFNFILGSTSIFALLGLVNMHNYNEFETKENETRTKDKIETQQMYMLMCWV